MSFASRGGQKVAAMAATAGTLAFVAMPAAAYASSAHPAPAVRMSHIRGIVPLHKGGTLPGNHHAASQVASATQAPATGPNTLYFQGGQTINGQHNQDVYTAKPKVYLVFYGNQWGTETTNPQGYQAFSGDTANAAVAAQMLFEGLGTNNESWSGVMTQYCDGPTVAVNASVCPAGAPHVAYPTGGGVLAGIWYDNTAPTPATATSDQLAAEAVAAATHFGNTTAASNRDAMYMVMSPKGANPDNYLNVNAGCAWHSDAFDAHNNWIPFTDQPYNLDLNNASGSCGAYFLGNNASDINDGYTITLGHEYAETLTDEYTDSGWVTPNATDGGENGDHCAWDPTSAFVNFATGAVAMQPTWSNDTNECDMSHVTVAGNAVTVTNPGNQSGTVGTAVSLQIAAVDSSSSATMTYTATGLPAGLSISAAGLISGTPTTVGTSSVTVTATDNTSVSGTASFSWGVVPAPTLTTGGNAAGATFTADASGSLTTTPRITAAANSVDGSVITMTSTGLPAGLTLSRITTVTSAAGVRPGTTEYDVTGQTNVNPGRYPVTVTVSDGPGNAADTTVSFGVVVPDPALIAPTVAVPPFQADKPFTYQIHASGGTGAYTFTFIPNSHTPRGVTMDANGLIHANVPMNNIDISTGWTFSYHVTDFYGGTARGTVNLTITPGDIYFRCLGTTSVQAKNCATHNLSDPAAGGIGHVGQAWATQVIKVGRGWSAPNGSGGGGDRFALYKGTLPAGMWLSPVNGWYGKQYVLIGGTPTRAGTYSFQIRATDQHGNSQTSYFTITIH